MLCTYKLLMASLFIRSLTASYSSISSAIDECSLAFMQQFQPSEMNGLVIHLSEFKMKHNLYFFLFTTQFSKVPDTAQILLTPDLWLRVCSIQQENK